MVQTNIKIILTRSQMIIDINQKNLIFIIYVFQDI